MRGIWVAFLAGALLSAAPAVGDAPADIVLKGSISGADNGGYRDLPFEVPAGVRRVTISFHHTGQAQHTVIDLGLFDKERFRGWSGGDKDAITVSETDATPSYLIGPVRAGTWHLILGIPNIRKDAAADYEADIRFTRDGAPLANSAFSDAPLVTGARWYRGDLHMHTAQSDGSCQSQSGRKVPCPLYKTLEMASARGLDFIAVSDHNTISQYNAERELQPYFDKLLLIPGREITTYRGHANVFGTTDFIDFRLGSSAVPDFNHLLDAVERAHGLISINHPKLPSGEVCMGCGWTVPETDYRRIQAIEIVNGGATALFKNAENPVSGIPFWEDLLNRGVRITGIGGSDNHNGPSETAAVGYPTTVVFADGLSDRAILDGIIAGHVFIDCDGTRYGLLEMTLQRGRARFMMGDRLAVRPGEKLTFMVHAKGFDAPNIRFEVDGKVVADVHYPASGILNTTDVTHAFPFAADGKRHWVRAEVRGAYGHVVLIGNPIYLNF
jgi:hypothetical protein